MLFAIPLVSLVINACFGLRGLDYKNSDVRAEVVYNSLCITLGVLNDYLVNTCVDRSIVACVRHTVRLNAYVEDINAIGVHKNCSVSESNLNATHVVRLVIELEMTVIVYISVTVNEIYVSGIGNDYECSVDGLCVIKSISYVKYEGDFSVDAVVKSILICGKDKLTVVSESKEEILNESGCVCLEHAVKISLCAKVIFFKVSLSEYVVIIPGLIVAELNLCSIGIDYHKSRASRRIVVGIGNYRNDKIYTDISVTDVILEGDLCSNGNLTNDISNLVECFNLNSKLYELFVYSINVADERSCSDSVSVSCFKNTVLLEYVVKPLGKVNVESAYDGFKSCNLVKVHRDTCRDNGSIGLKSGNIYGRGVNEITNLMFFTVPLINAVINAGLGLRGLNYKRANALTCVSDISVCITNDDDRSDGVNTRMYGSFLAYVRHTVCLNAYVVVTNAIGKIKKIACLIAVTVLLEFDNEVIFHTVFCGIIELKMTVIIYISAVIAEIYVKRFSNNNDGTGKNI